MDEIINALRNLKMPGMAHYWATMQETRQAESLSLKDGLQLLIQAELDNRNQSRNTRLIKKARFRYQASISEVIYDSKRGVDKQKVLNLATCDYVKKWCIHTDYGRCRNRQELARYGFWSSGLHERI